MLLDKGVDIMAQGVQYGSALRVASVGDDISALVRRVVNYIVYCLVPPADTHFL